MTSLLWEPAAADPIPAIVPRHAAMLEISPDPFPKGHFAPGIPPRGLLVGHHHRCCQGCRRDSVQHPWGLTLSTSKGRLSPTLCLGWSGSIPLAPGHRQAKGAVGKCQPNFTVSLGGRSRPQGCRLASQREL